MKKIIDYHVASKRNNQATTHCATKWLRIFLTTASLAQGIKALKLMHRVYFVLTLVQYQVGQIFFLPILFLLKTSI